MNEEPTAAEAAEMAKYGIVLRPVAYFHLGEYRYTSVRDAIAAGRREGSRG